MSVYMFALSCVCLCLDTHPEVFVCAASQGPPAGETDSGKLGFAVCRQAHLPR